MLAIFYGSIPRGGIVQYDIFSGTKTVFDPANSDLKSRIYNDIAVDQQGRVWVTHEFGVARYDGTSWPEISRTNFGFAEDVWFGAIEVTQTGDVWLRSAYGLFKFDGNSYTLYDGSIHPALSITGYPNSLYFDDSNGILWVGTNYAGLLSYDGNNWAQYDTTNSPLSSNFVRNVSGMDNGKVLGSNFYDAYFEYDLATWETGKLRTLGVFNENI